MKFLRIFPPLIAIFGVAAFSLSQTLHGHLPIALRALIVPSGIIAFVAWREWKIVRDPDYAGRQAQKEASPFNQARLAGAICLGLILVPALLLLWLSRLYPKMWDGVRITGTEGVILLYAAFFIPIAVMAWRYFSVRRRVSRRP